jgi:hypothetical protein
METRNRNTLVIVVVVLVLACCCGALAVAAALGLYVNRSVGVGDLDLSELDLGGIYRERMERTFEVGDAPDLEIDNFAGTVSVQAGERGVVYALAVKKGSSRSRVEQVEVEMSERPGGVVIKTRNQRRFSNVSVDLEITVPADTRLRINSGAGTMDLRGIEAEINVNSGAGTIRVRDARGPVRLSLGAGEIRYEGQPVGNCRFETGAGNIDLRLPADLDAEVDLGVGMGNVNVDYRVDGRVRVREVQGVIGDGSDASILAHSGVGTISLHRR